MTYEIQADSLRHLPFFRLPDPFFISGSGVCRSSDFYIQMQSFQLHQRTHFAFSPGHYSPSNDRLSPYADYPAQKRYFVITATKGACIFASMHLAAAPTCPGISPDSLVQQEQECVSGSLQGSFSTTVCHACRSPSGSRICHKSHFPIQLFIEKNRLPSAAVHAFSQHPGPPVLFSLGAPPQIPAAITKDSSLRLPSH